MICLCPTSLVLSGNAEAGQTSSEKGLLCAVTSEEVSALHTALDVSPLDTVLQCTAAETQSIACALNSGRILPTGTCFGRNNQQPKGIGMLYASVMHGRWGSSSTPPRRSG